METNLSRETNKPSSSQEIPCILWNTVVHYRVHNSPPLVPILSHMKTVRALRSCLRSILMLSSHLRIFLSGEGPRSRRYGRTAALRLIVQPCDEDDDDDDYFLSSS
jgi:hypothetical protein